MLNLIGYALIQPFQELWSTGYADAELFTNHQDPWLQVIIGKAKWHLKLSQDGRCLTVRKGNQYGHFFDGYGCDVDWAKLGQSCQDSGIDTLSYPGSVGRVAAGLISDISPVSGKRLPEPVLQLAHQAAKGSRMEALTMGSVEGYAYDYSSAFPHVALTLPACDTPNQCDWKESTRFQRSAFYGFALIDVTIPEMEAGPLAIRANVKQGEDLHSETMLMFPIGRMKVHVSMPEMLLLNDMGIDYKIIKGVWGFPSRDNQPLRKLMQQLWDLRQFYKDGAKALSVAVIGQLGSAHWDDGDVAVAGQYYQPVMYSHILAQVRCDLYRKGLAATDVLAYCIDGLITSQPMPVDNPGFGAWTLESEGKYFLANDYFKDREGSSGIYRKAVESTPDSVSDDHFQIEMPKYTSLATGIGSREEWSKLGQTEVMAEAIRLGSEHRIMESEPTRALFLSGPIHTKVRNATANRLGTRNS
jgi:hypothetical protein